ncbi:hypothetical protein [Shinella pollutisoli]|uniref:Uncharacterized protein n=1 Tax=Shinella pollutisoli TaxID=2250594 RepID=A0ABV7DA91_9HYPH|nr:hypothetical protein [Shinella pollutisoli]
MSNLVPIIDELENARTDAARARWLLQCPPGYLGKYEMTIRNRLRSAGFLAGIDYLETERLVIWMPRGATGEMRAAAQEMLAAARSAMVAIAEGGA